MRFYFTDKKHVGSNAWEYSFKKPEGIDYRPGQNCMLVLPHDNPDDRGEFRQMSLSSAPYEPTIQFICRVFDTGSSFKSALGLMKPGDVLYARKPQGGFLQFSEEQLAGPIVMCAAGVGVTPFYSFLKDVSHRGITLADATLVYGNRSEQDTILAREIEDLCAKLGVKQINIYSQGAGDSEAAKGRISIDLLRSLNLFDTSATYAFCGSPEFGYEMRGAVIEAGLSPEQIHSSTFDDYTSEEI